MVVGTENGPSRVQVGPVRSSPAGPGDDSCLRTRHGGPTSWPPLKHHGTDFLDGGAPASMRIDVGWGRDGQAEAG